jgi:UDP-N-acetyl-2-amino-2-deoxyglucuronate dehydrogenase
MSDNYGFALVGCGRIAQRYMDLLGQGQIAGARLVGVCDIKTDRAEAAGHKFAVPHFSEMTTMMEAIGKQVDIVCVLTESGRHAEHVLALAPYGKHILVEKPMALRLADAEEMIKACDSANVRLFVVKQNRYNLPIVKLRRALDQGRFGKLVMGTVRVRWCRPQAYYDQASWRGTWQYDGGVFANQASHHIDMLMWMLGEPVSVVAKTSTALVRIEAEDTGAAILQFRNGAIGIVEATTATRPKDLEGSISILGEHGAVEVGGFAMNHLKTWQFAETQPDDKDILERFSENPPDVYGFGHRRYLENVVTSLRGQGGRLVDGLEGLRSLELIVAMYESVVTGREVNLRFSPQHLRLGQGK